MYIMLDQSGSMSDSVSGGGTKWSAVTNAFKTFVTQPGTDGIGIGIQYFPLAAGGATCTLNCTSDADCGALGPCFVGICFGCAASGSNDSCNPVDYAKPDVEIATLPGAAAAFTASIKLTPADQQHPHRARPSGRDRSRQGLGEGAPQPRRHRRPRDRRRARAAARTTRSQTSTRSPRRG